jgi:hypothetical protein
MKWICLPARVRAVVDLARERFAAPPREGTEAATAKQREVTEPKSASA